MNTDQGFLTTLADDPGDETLRLIYADWLQEQNDPRGEWLRRDVELARIPTNDPRHTETAARVESLASTLDGLWLAQVGEKNQERCDVVLTECLVSPYVLAHTYCKWRGIAVADRAYPEVGRKFHELPATIACGIRRADAEEIQRVLSYFDPGESTSAGQEVREESRELLSTAVVEIRVNHPLTTLGSFRPLLPTPVKQEADEHETGEILWGGDPGLVALRATAEALAVCVYGVRWEGHTPVNAHRPLKVWSWSELPVQRLEQLHQVHSAIQEAMRLRLEKFSCCRFCQKSLPPEWMHGREVCSSCAEKYLGVVY